jgi:hypothetical protein
LETTAQKLNKLSKNDVALNDILSDLKARMTISGSKYDFTYRSITKSLTQTSATSDKTRYFTVNHPELIKQKSENSVEKKSCLSMNSSIFQKNAVHKRNANPFTISRKNSLNMKLSKISIPFMLIIKIKSLRTKIAKIVKKSEDLFKSIDKHFDERIELNSKFVKFYHDNVIIK